MNTITLILSKTEIEILKNNFKDEIVNKTIPYVLFQIKTEGCTITAYSSLKVVFQGVDSQVYASSFLKNEFIEQAGSDEVGTGDYFGPVVVCACIVTKNDLNILNQLNVQDSKAIKDETILEIGPKLIELLPHSTLIVSNLKYNQVHKENNMNQIKSKLHNQAYINLKKKNKLPNHIIIDQFTPKNNYYKYLDNQKEIIENIHFETKAESKYISVACASIIARYTFLKKWEEMENKYDFKFTKGASSKVDLDAKRFVKEFGINELKNVAKLHFKNTERINIID